MEFDHFHVFAESNMEREDMMVEEPAAVDHLPTIRLSKAGCWKQVEPQVCFLSLSVGFSRALPKEGD